MEPNRPPPWTLDEKSGVDQPPSYEESTAGNPPPPGFYHPLPPPYPKPDEASFPFAQQPLVIVHPTNYVSSDPLQQPYPDYRGFSIFNLLCCCLPLGIAAFIYSVSTRDANRAGDRALAKKYSRLTRILNISALGFGIVFVFFCIFVRTRYIFSNWCGVIDHHGSHNESHVKSG